jgi:hypothetical protein
MVFRIKERKWGQSELLSAKLFKLPFSAVLKEEAQNA